MAQEVMIPEQVLPYLLIQRGDLAHFKNDRAMWEQAYRRHLAGSYLSMLPYLPERRTDTRSHLRSILDVGSGMGGIDILLYKHYQGQGSGKPHLSYGPIVTLLDGDRDPPRVVRQDQTFSNAAAAMYYLTKNGVDQSNLYFMSPGKLTVRKYDLIVSMGSWCFHYSPSVYMTYVLESCIPGTRLILDVRVERPLWIAELCSTFKHLATIPMADKFQRMVFDA